METVKQIAKPEGPLKRAGRFVLDQLRGGAWAELAERYAPQIGDAALQDTVEFEPVLPNLDYDSPPRFPHGLELCDPVEHGWRYRSAEIPDEAA